jgi:hypothetical protein
MLNGSLYISSIIERTKRRKKLNGKKNSKSVEDKLFHILVLWQKLMMSNSYFEKKNLQFEF